MKSKLLGIVFALFVCGFFSSAFAAHHESHPVYEIRTYYANEGKLDDLLARFRDHTVALFEKHGIENVGYWVPADNKENQLVYIIKFPSKEEQPKLWKDFYTDPDWKAAYAESTKNGKLVSRVESVFLNATDFSTLK